MSTTVKNANDLHTTWAARFNARDLEGMVALAEPDSSFVPQPGIVVTGEGVRKAEEQFLQMGLPITLVPRRAIVNGDIALLISDWTIKGKANDGSNGRPVRHDGRRGPTRSGWLEIRHR